MAKAETRTLSLEAIEKQLATVRDPVVQRIETINMEIAELESEKSKLDAMLARIDGRPQSNGRGGGKRGKRMSADDIAKTSADILKAIAGAGKDGIGRAAIVEKLGIKPTSATAILRQLAQDKKVKMQGKKAAARYIEA